MIISARLTLHRRKRPCFTGMPSPVFQLMCVLLSIRKRCVKPAVGGGIEVAVKAERGLAVVRDVRLVAKRARLITDDTGATTPL